MTSNGKTKNLQFLAGGGEMGALTRNRDWAETSLGPPEAWPQSLRTTLSILLNSKFPMFLFWGKDLTCFYNDAYRPSLGMNGKHPDILGMAGKEAWPEIWTIIEPLLDQVLSGGESTWSEDQLIPIYRNGRLEDVYWTFSYSPVNDESGSVSGVMVTCSETTDKIITYKKLQESSDQLQFAIESAELGTWDFNPATNKFTANDRLKSWFGLPAGAELDLSLAVNAIAEKDRDRVTNALAYALDFSSGGKYDVEYAIVHPVTNRETIVQAKGKAFFNDKNIAYRFNGTLQDVTAQALSRKKIEESGKRFRETVEQAPLGITIFRGHEFIVEMANETYLQIIGRTEKEFVGMRLFDVLPEIRDLVEPMLKTVLETGDSNYGRAFPVTLKRFGKAEAVYFDFVYHPLREDDGRISGIIIVATEVTEAVSAMLRLEESEKRFKNVADSAPVLIWMSGTDNICNFFNKAWLSFTGRSMEEEQGSGWTDNIHAEDIKRCLDTYDKALHERREFYIEFRLKRHDGDYRWISDTGVPRFTGNGIFEGFIGACMDIHENTLHQNKLKENEERLNIVINAGGLATWELNLQTHEVYYSDRYMKMMGYEAGTVLSHSDLLKHVHPADMPLRDKAFAEASGTGYIHYISRIVPASGSIRWAENRGKVFFDHAGNPLKLIGTTRDITEEKNVQHRLEEREQKFRLLADSMPQFVWTGDPEGNLNYFNQAVYNYSGLSSEEIEKNGWLPIVHPDEREENISKWVHSIQTGENFIFEHRFRRHDGIYRWQLSRAIPQRDINGDIQMWVGTSTDIQEQKMFASELERQVQERLNELNDANRALRESEERYHSMVDEVQDYAILYLNKNGFIENWNKGAEKIKGYAANDIIGKNFSVFYTDADRRDGLPPRLLMRATDEGRAVQEGHRVRKDGSLFWASVVITAIHDDQKNVIGFSKVTHDLTEKKNAEDKLKRNAHELEQKNKELLAMNIELQSFAYISSHDLQEPLRKIQVFATMIKQSDGNLLSEDGKNYLGRMENAAARMQTLIKDLLSYSRTSLAERNFEKIDLNKIMDEVKADLKDDIRQKNATIESGQLCEANIIPFQFHQLMINLIGNALKFSVPGRPPVIRVECKLEKPGTLHLPGLYENKAYCHVKVSDNGIGFEPQYKDKIFEVFQRLHGKSEYKGTGIGLAIVKKIVDNHDGVITATGELNKGACFDIYFPSN